MRGPTPSARWDLSVARLVNVRVSQIAQVVWKVDRRPGHAMEDRDDPTANDQLPQVPIRQHRIVSRWCLLDVVRS